MQRLADVAGTGERDRLQGFRVDQRVVHIAARTRNEVDHAFGMPAS